MYSELDITIAQELIVVASVFSQNFFELIESDAVYFQNWKIYNGRPKVFTDDDSWSDDSFTERTQ